MRVRKIKLPRLAGLDSVNCDWYACFRLDLIRERSRDDAARLSGPLFLWLVDLPWLYGLCGARRTRQIRCRLRPACGLPAACQRRRNHLHRGSAQWKPM
jgi:hypothetical protein